jgi:hypothetical protein
MQLFSSISKHFDTLRQKYAKEKLIFLTESIKCENENGWIYLLDRPESANQSAILNIGGIFGSIESFLALDEDFFEANFVQTGIVKRAKCSDKTTTGNEAEDAAAKKFGLALQWDLDELLYKNSRTINGDIEVTSISPAAKFFFALLTCKPESCISQELLQLTETEVFQTFRNYFIQDFRNQNLLSKAAEHLDTADAIVLPWGFNHHVQLEASLLKAGYTHAESNPLLYSHCPEFKSDVVGLSTLPFQLVKACFSNQQEFENLKARAIETAQ